jgi:uncharacterized membrane protein YgdD (TMEM256/DUF423 family)
MTATTSRLFAEFTVIGAAALLLGWAVMALSLAIF